MEGTDYLELTTAQILKQRCSDVLGEIKAQKSTANLDEFSAFCLSKEPIYNCPKGLKKIRNTWYKITPDLRITELLQDYRNELLKAA